MSELRPYDPDTPCTACNADQAATRYCAVGVLEAVEWPGGVCIAELAAAIRFVGALPELRRVALGHHHRTCRRCGYEWLEALYVPAPPPPPSRKRQRTQRQDDEE